MSSSLRVFIMLISSLILFLHVACQSNANKAGKNCGNCTLLLKPIIDFKLCLGMTPNEVSTLFDSFEEYDADPRIRRKNTTYFEVKTNVVLPNNKPAKLNGNLKFISGKLVLVNVVIPICKDYKYIQKLKAILKKHDKEGLNKYIYETERYSGKTKSKDCTKMFLWRRSFEDMDIQEINVKLFAS